MLGTRDQPAERDASRSLRDASLSSQIRDRYWTSGYLALRGITCTCRNGVVWLRGCLPSYYLKQVAQSIPIGMRQVRRVVNRIAVLTPAVRRARTAPDSEPAHAHRGSPAPGPTAFRPR